VPTGDFTKFRNLDIATYLGGASKDSFDVVAVWIQNERGIIARRIAGFRAAQARGAIVASAGDL
jgi:hypothetical protein